MHYGKYFFKKFKLKPEGISADEGTLRGNVSSSLGTKSVTVFVAKLASPRPDLYHLQLLNQR